MDSTLTDGQDDIHSYDEYDTSTLSSSKVATIRPNYNFPFHSSSLKDSYNRHLHSSDSILNRYAANCLDSDDNLYDDPADMLSSSMGNCIDQREESSSSSPATPPSATAAPKKKVVVCPYYADHTRYFKAIKPETDSKQQQQHQQFQRYNLGALSEIHDYDLYYGLKRNHQYDSIQRKLLYSPLRRTQQHHHQHGHQHHHQNHHSHNHHHNSHYSANRPNSRNSLNSRLSSSHNSLSVSNSNKADDSIFITQAMSHDALLSRVEICDFYNVPIDSDIYAFPVDMIDTPAPIHDIAKFNAKDYTYKPPVKNSSSSSSSHHKARKNKRRKRHQQQQQQENKTTASTTTTITTSVTAVVVNNNNNINNNLNYNTTEESNSEIDKLFSKHKQIYHHHRKGCIGRPMFNYSEGGSATDSPSVSEPLHMSLDEVKQFYHTIYSDGEKGAAEHNNNVVSSSNGKAKSQEIGQQKINQSTNTTATISRTISIKPVNNNNNQNQKNSCKMAASDGGKSNQITSSSAGQDSKKSQFTFNLKQRFCSLFRFRNKNRNSRINSTDSSSDFHLQQQSSNKSSFLSAEDKRKKFQSRALPPLPNKCECFPFFFVFLY